MNTVTIAFDIDGTLRDSALPEAAPLQANEPVRALLIQLAGLRNTRIVVWSARGQQYATEVAHRLCIQQYVDGYASKANNPMRPHIAIDDLEDCQLGAVNLVV